MCELNRLKKPVRLICLVFVPLSYVWSSGLTSPPLQVVLHLCPTFPFYSVSFMTSRRLKRPVSILEAHLFFVIKWFIRASFHLHSWHDVNSSVSYVSSNESMSSPNNFDHKILFSLVQKTNEWSTKQTALWTEVL